MDPNLFAIDSGRVAEVLGTIVLLSFFVERALAMLFENKIFVERFASRGVKEPITLLVAFGVCRYWDFDALSVILVKEKTQFWGHLLTAAIVSGGSKASIKFFHDVLGAMSTAEQDRQAVTKRGAPAKPHVAAVPAVAAAPAAGTGGGH